MAFFLARVSGSSFQQPPALLGGGGAGMSASCCEGAVSRYAAVMPTTVQSDSGKRERSSATSNFVLGAGRRRRGPHDPRRQPEEVVRELHPVLVLVVYGRARQQDLEADLREEGQPNRQQVLEPVHQQPHGVDGEDAGEARGFRRPRAGAAQSQRPRRWERAAPPEAPPGRRRGGPR